jgi:pilus assembly protein CpaF
MNDTTILLKKGEYQMNLSRRHIPEMDREYSDVKLEQVRQYLLESHQNLLQQSLFDLKQREKVEANIRSFLEKDGYVGSQLDQMASAMTKEICGLGPIDELFFDDTVTDIMVNHYDEIWVTYYGDRNSVRSPNHFENEEHVRRIATKIAHASGQQLSLTNATPVCYLPGARVSIVIPPISQRGTTLTIRKFNNRLKPFEEMVAQDVLTEEALQFLKASMMKGLNMIVAGPVGAGKTTFIRHLIQFVPDSERLLVIENVPELRLSDFYPDKNIVSYATRESANKESHVDLDLLFERSLRQNMRRFIFGEILGKEAMTVMEAMNTGHIGLTTMHASNAADAVERIIMMCLRTDRSVSPEYLGKLITRTLNVVIYMEDLKIMEIVEVHDYTDGKVQVRKLFERVDGQLKTKLHPSESLGLNVEVERNIRVV